MYDVPDHPVIQNMERTGYPDGREPEETACPVCGSFAEDFFVAAGNTVVGCDICLRRIPYHEYEAEVY